MIATATEIENFIEVYQIQHISKAAIRLGITQPSLTQSLQKLEEKVGAKLFYRSKQGLTATQEGHLFYDRARSLLDNWRDVGNQFLESRNVIAGKFRVGCHPSVACYTLPSLFSQINEHAPNIEIELVHDFSRKITEQIISYQVDLGFVVNPVRHLDLVLKKIGEDEVQFWKSKTVATVPQRIFADTNLKQVEALLTKTIQKDFKNWTLVPTSSLETARELTAQGHGVCILPTRVARNAKDPLTIYMKSLPTFHDEIYLAYRKEVLSSQAGRALIKLASNPI